MTGVLTMPNDLLIPVLSTASPGLGRKGGPSETGGVHRDAPVLASNAQIRLDIEQTYKTSCAWPSFITSPGTYSGCASILGSSPVSFKLNNLVIPLAATFAGSSV